MTTGRLVALVVVIVATAGVAGYKTWMMLQLRGEEPGASRRAGLGALHSLLIGGSGAVALALGPSIRRYAVWIIAAVTVSAGLSIWWDRSRRRSDADTTDR